MTGSEFPYSFRLGSNVFQGEEETVKNLAQSVNFG